MKIFTDIQQSKKLAEFLPAKSADVVYDLHRIGTFLGSWANQPIVFPKELLEYNNPDAVPCFSLASLCDLFPSDKESPIFNITRGGYNIKGSYTRDWFVTLEDEDSNIKYSEQAPELIDAVVNMIINLKEKNLL